MVAQQETPLVSGAATRPSSRLPWCLAWATAVYTVLLVFATHYPRPQEILGTGPDLPTDKTMHVVAYGILGLLASATLAAWGRWTLQNVIGLAAALALLGGLDEITQPIFSRIADPLDWIGDCTGIALGMMAVATGRKIRNRDQ